MSSLLVLVILAVPVLALLVLLAVWPWSWPTATARLWGPTLSLVLCVTGVLWAGLSQSLGGVGAFAVPGILAAVVLGLRLREQRRGRSERPR